MEKRGYIDPEWTPDIGGPEKQGETLTTEQKIDKLDDDLIKRLTKECSNARTVKDKYDCNIQDVIS